MKNIYGFFIQMNNDQLLMIKVRIDLFYHFDCDYFILIFIGIKRFCYFFLQNEMRNIKASNYLQDYCKKKAEY